MLGACDEILSGYFINRKINRVESTDIKGA